MESKTPASAPRPHVHAILVTVAFALFWVPVIIFAKLAGEVIEREPLGADTAIIDGVHAAHTALLDNFFLFMTSIGEPLVVVAAAVGLVIGFLLRRLRRDAAMIIGGVGGAAAANLVLKLIFARARPSIFTPLIRETSYSFPSGHAMVSAAFVTSLIVILWPTRYRLPALIVGSLLTFLIGLSRVYLGVHYPSDVLAGWCVGVVWALVTGSLVLNRPFGLGRIIAARLHRA